MELLQAVPDELEFCFQPGRVLCRSFHLHNVTSMPVAFKLKTNAAQSYIVKPGRGLIAPGDNARISTYMQPQLYMPVSHQFLLQVRRSAQPYCWVLLPSWQPFRFLRFMFTALHRVYSFAQERMTSAASIGCTVSRRSCSLSSRYTDPMCLT